MDRLISHDGPFSRPGTLWLLALVAVNVAIMFVYLSSDDPSEAGEVPDSAIATSASDPEGLTLLGELDSKKIAQMQRRSVIAGPALVCRVWGPLNSESALEAVKSDVRGVGALIEVRTAEVAPASGFLVYLTADNNPDNARRLQKELTAQSIDAYVMAGGNYVNSVSVGVFSERGRAQAYAGRLADLGYTPLVADLGRPQTVYHLVARVPEDHHTPDFPYANCPAIASLD